MLWRGMRECRYRSVSFTPRPLCPQGNGPRYSLDRSLVGAQNRSGRCGEQKNITRAGNGTVILGLVAATEISVPFINPYFCLKIKQNFAKLINGVSYKEICRAFPPRRPGFASGQACGVCGGQCGTGAGFLRVLRFPLSIIIPPISPSS
jgi:hypothetical protein